MTVEAVKFADRGQSTLPVRKKKKIGLRHGQNPWTAKRTTAIPCDSKTFTGEVDVTARISAMTVEAVKFADRGGEPPAGQKKKKIGLRHGPFFWE